MANTHAYFLRCQTEGKAVRKTIEACCDYVLYDYKHSASTAPAVVAPWSKGTPNIPAPFRFYGSQAKVHEPYIISPILKQ